MAPKRPGTPPPVRTRTTVRTRKMKFNHPEFVPPSTPGPENDTAKENPTTAMSAEHATVPPSPGVSVPGFESFTMVPIPEPAQPARKTTRKSNAYAGARIQKPLKKTGALREHVRKDTFRFMDLPGEVRNEVYEYTYDNPKQALLVHRPRIASLRPRTRIDRGRTLASDVTDQEHDEELFSAGDESGGSGNVKAKNKAKSFRETNRPFWGLTQVSRQIRNEYRPIYLAKQEIGMDLTEIVSYLRTFYASLPEEIAKLGLPGERECDMPFVGNLTVAVGDVPNGLERASDGVDVTPLLDIWANSLKIEAGFGRYLKQNYTPQTDGEAKDLYRLFGRRVLKNRACSAMNNLWRTILRSRSLQAVRIHRKPAPRPSAPVPIVTAQTGVLATIAALPIIAGGLVNAPVVTKPYIHIVFKKEAAEPWMNEFESVIPKIPTDWLEERGFDRMEYFDVKVGVEQDRMGNSQQPLTPVIACHLANNFDDTFCCHYIADSDAESHTAADMSRPQSMPDFAALMESSTSLFESTTSSNFEKRIHSRRQTSPERRAQHGRKKPSLSLAAGLMMNTDSPIATGSLSPRKRSQSRPSQERIIEMEEGANLFYAYALRSDYPSSPPYILTFASATICSQWWNLVQQEYPSSARPSPQFFVVRTEDFELMQDDLKFFDLRNQWFYTSQDSPSCPPIVLPLQYANGAPAVSPPQPAEDKASNPAIDSLAESLTRLAGVVESNAEQVHALSVAQSTGLQAMQEINESNSIQIKAISESQTKLQALVDQNASHYIALSNTSFQSQQQSRQSQEKTRMAQEQTRDILKTTVSQLQTLSKNQTELSQTCKGMMRSIENLSNTFTQFSTSAISDTASNHSLSSNSFNALAPPPRKLNKRVKGVWYEYDNLPTPSATPRKRVDSINVDTPPKSPMVIKSI
ncbi:hypothetical protein DDE83_002818 [Stemphylium lycopersici]|uniref:Uncharacterized protein n=1 Tax=Stemphylium lycopersici TaxID=183478 RepID=A0A364N9T5_STELY|nr:hypothetical protein DDE83_002818 [Stemphylium lycopersici]